MQTGSRWAGRANPRDLTKMRQQELIAKRDRDKAARELTAADLAEIRADEHAKGVQLGHAQGWDAAIAFLEHAGYVHYEREADTLHRLTDAEFDAVPDDDEIEVE